MNKIIISLLLFCVSCSTPPEPIIQYVEPEPMVINVAGNNVRPADLENLRYREDIKGYTYNRYIDPLDPTIMYEQGIVYREEQKSSWNLQPNLPVKVPFEGTVKKLISDDDRLVSLELGLIAEEQRKTARWLKLVKEETLKSLGETKESLAIAKKINEQNLKLEAQILEIQKKNKALKSEIKNIKDTTKKVVKYYELKEQKRLEELKKNKYRRN